MKKYLCSLVLIFAFCLLASAQEPTPVPAPETVESRPISIGIVVDNSGSFRMVLEYVIKTAQSVSKVVESKDEAFLVRFISKDKIEVLQDFTNNKNSLISAADDMYVEGGLTAISEALMFSAKHLLEKGKSERKILILITDGEDKSDKVASAQTLAFLKENKIPVFVIGLTATLDQNVAKSKKFLEKLASETNGSVNFIDKGDDYRAAADALIKTVRTQ
jgi:VWFA-related protein